MRIVVCEDSYHDMNALITLIEQYQAKNKWADVAIVRYSDPKKLLSQLPLSSGNAVYFLDIIMPEISGIELAKAIRKADSQSAIIFITSSKSYALEAFSVSALQYLLKPVVKKELFQAMDRAMQTISSAEEKFFLLTTPDGMVNIPFNSILFIESKGHIMNFHLLGGATLKSVNLRSTFESATAPLLADSRFIHPHKSYTVNMDHVQKLALPEFIMEDGAHVPISRRKCSETKKLYVQYLVSK